MAEGLQGIFASAKNFVFLGESGCGKTEIALSFARALAAEGERVLLFDMDQTKPLLRAREAAAELAAAGVRLCFQEQLLDSPIVPPAVRESLADPGCRVVMDVGGSDLGAHMIGQFADAITRSGSRVFFVINPNRSWSRSREAIAETAARLAAATGLHAMEPVSNPNFGPTTTAPEVLEGHRRLLAMLEGETPRFLAAAEALCHAVAPETALPLLPVRFFRESL